MKPKNDPLPPFEDKYWEKDAENLTHELKQKSCNSNHKFRPTPKANEVKCDCGVGYILTPGMNVWADGHIYINNYELVI